MEELSRKVEGSIKPCSNRDIIPSKGRNLVLTGDKT